MKEGRLIFISMPNSCDGCPVEKLFLAGIPFYYKVAHECDRLQNVYNVVYKLTDLGRTICYVYEKIEGKA